MNDRQVSILKNLLLYSSLLFVFIYLKSIDYLSLPPINDIPCAFLAFVLLISGFVLQVCCWHLVLGLFGANVMFKHSFSSVSKTMFAKYIPGKIWQITGRAGYISTSTCINLKTAMKISFFAQCTSIFAGVVLAISMLVLDENLASLLGVERKVGLSLLAIIAAASFFVMFFFREKCGFRNISLYIVVSLFPWVFWGSGFYFLTKSLTLELDMAAAMGTFTIAALAGIFAYFFPGGLGVREGVMAVILGTFGFALDVSIGVSIVARLWFLLGELFFFLLSFLPARASK